MPTKVDLNDDLVLEELLASYDSEHHIYSFFRDKSSGKKLTIPRLQFDDTGDECLAFPFEEHNLVVTLPFFKHDCVPSNYERRIVPILYSSIAHNLSDLADDGATILLFSREAIDSSSIAGLVLYEKGVFADYMDDPTVKHYGCFMIPLYVFGRNESDTLDFLRSHYDEMSCPDPSFYKLPTQVYMEAATNYDVTH